MGIPFLPWQFGASLLLLFSILPEGSSVGLRDLAGGIPWNGGSSSFPYSLEGERRDEGFIE
jgi:hypothetical protein